MTRSQTQIEKVIVGLGKTGMSCARFLASQDIPFAITDSRDLPSMLSTLKQELPEIPTSLSAIDTSLLLKANEIIVSPGVSLNEPAIKAAIDKGIPVIGDIELFCRYAKAPVLAVTGSNGKSTVASLLAEMIKLSDLQVGLGGNIGTPALELLDADEPDFYVLELSSFQLETLESLNAVVAVIMNISEDHMDRYDSIDDYIKAKSRIYHGNGVMIINRDDQHLNTLDKINRSFQTFGCGEPTGDNYGLKVEDEHLYLMQGSRKLFDTKDIKIKGQHNYLNALAAIAMGNSIKLPEEKMLQALKTFSGLSHRCEWIKRVNGVDWYNDSKGTNVGATSAAIIGLAKKNNLILIAGGVGKDADFSPLAIAAKDRVKAVITIGQDGPSIATIMQTITIVQNASSLPIAVNMAAELAETDDIVLLSPACASFDMFTDYQHRGDVFIQAVQELKITR